MRKLARIFALIVSLAMGLSALSACQSGPAPEASAPEFSVSVSDTTTSGADSASESTTLETTSETSSETASELDTATTSTAQTTATTAKPSSPISANSMEFVKNIKIGWNLGNTLDATGSSGLGSETSWGNPKTTKGMIDALKGAGFNTLRIPVSWGKHTGAAPDYTIDEDWMDRVQEVVDYGIDNGMYVILNMHHEDWHFPSYDNLDSAKAQLTKMWAQIAKRFQDYDEHLIFEGLNEPRKTGTNVEWTGGDEESWDVVNQLDAAFVDTIRDAGGNNKTRFLMIPPYAASASPNAQKALIVPEDDRIIVSIHGYAPYDFALNPKGTDAWSADNLQDTRDIKSVMTAIDMNFLSKGIPVIIGEFGAVDKDNTATRASWSTYYVGKAAEYGIPCIWWDNGAFEGSGENFGLLDRRTLEWKAPEVVTALMDGIQ